jgi:hypothetical protein
MSQCRREMKHQLTHLIQSQLLIQCDKGGKTREVLHEAAEETLLVDVCGRSLGDASAWTFIKDSLMMASFILLNAKL